MVQKYEQISQNSHLGGTSFTVNNETNRLYMWKKLLYLRYYIHLGKRDDINVKYNSIINMESTDIEDRYKISTNEKEKLSISITVYHSTGKILIQGVNRKEWVKNEFEKLKMVLDSAKEENELAEHYIRVYEI